MILCEHDCTPVCDFCIYCKHKLKIYKDKDRKFFKWRITKGEPLCCKRNKIKRENFTGGGYCEDFHCFLAGKK